MKYNLVNKRFGKLLVLSEIKERAKNRQVFWHCKCDCGREKNITTQSLTKGTRSCGCSKRKDLTGYKNRYIEVLRFDHVNKENAYWLCRCRCGNEFVTKGVFVVNGKTTSCGCKKKIGKNHRSWKGVGELPGAYWSKIEDAAKTRGIAFSISKEFGWNLFLQQKGRCKLTNEILSFNSGSLSRNGSASLDRIDPSKGYIEGNVQWIHKDVNYMKCDFTEEEFINWCQLIVKHYASSK